MAAADGAVRELVASEVLRPSVVEQALARALEVLRSDANGSDRRQVLTAELAGVEAELRNLAETAAQGGAVPAILTALDRREADRRRLQAELAACAADPSVTRTPVAVLRAQLRDCLDDWHALLRGNMAEARPLLDLVLADRIGFTPTADRGYELNVPIAFDRVLTAVIPGLEGVQDRMASPTGFEPVS